MGTTFRHEQEVGFSDSSVREFPGFPWGFTKKKQIYRYKKKTTTIFYYVSIVAASDTAAALADSANSL